MKGTLFSADFVTDKDNNLRLIEINTDTGIVNSQQSILDWSDFVNILNTNSITDVDVVYKYDIQHPIVESLETYLLANAPTIALTKIVVPSESIFPTSPEDSESKFILRMAYDESAILDSEYAKGTLGLLKLFADAKMIFVNKYNSAIYTTKHFVDDGKGGLKVTAPEGYVAVDRIGNGVKLIDRLEFNQDTKLPKNWAEGHLRDQFQRNYILNVLNSINAKKDDIIIWMCWHFRTIGLALSVFKRVCHQ